MDTDVSDERYRSINHSERMIRKMEYYYEKKQLCDVVLVVGRRRIHAHRMVLSAASDYFAAMFTSDVREANESEVTLKQIDPDALAGLVDYAYTGEWLGDYSNAGVIVIK